MKNYLIKQGMNYLHADKVNGALVFQTFKDGATLYLKDEADIVLNTMKKAGLTGVFKSAVKSKFVQVNAPKPAVAAVIEKIQQNRARKRLNKK